MSRFVMPLVIGVFGVAVLVALGVWQVQRLQWKEAILAEIDARLVRAPVALPADPQPEPHRFVPVTVSGAVAPEPTFVFTNVPGMGVRFRVIQAMTTDEGRRILLESGIVLPDLVDEPMPAGPVEVTGMLHWPDEQDGFTPPPDPVSGVWYARDLDALAATHDTAPVLVVATEVTPPSAVVFPLPLAPDGIPNNHLEYAVTWFGLAVVWAGMTGLWLWRLARPAAAARAR